MSNRFSRRRSRRFDVCILFVCLLQAACGHRTPTAASVPAASALPPPPATSAAASSFYGAQFSKQPTVAAMTRLGRAVFFDPALSASGHMACATCHDPAYAYGPPPTLHTAASRAVPSLKYLQTVPPFSEHHFDEAVDESVDQGPTGGHTWDGRADTAHDQARLPLFSPIEMANPDARTVVAKIAAASYARCFRETFGNDVFADEQRAFHAALMVLEVFQQNPPEFYPYTSKYDAWLRGQTALTAAETRGLAAFNSEARGNCASCHPSQIHAGVFPQFTDYGFIALGVPRNPRLAVNADPRYFDLGLCGPVRTDLIDRAEYCGRFKAPSLRNVTRRSSFFHNGVIIDLRRAVEFYAARDTAPERFYPKDRRGHVDKYDDLPAQYRANINVEPPFGERPGHRPVLDAGSIADIVTFLHTLEDGWKLSNPAPTAVAASAGSPPPGC